MFHRRSAPSGAERSRRRAPSPVRTSAALLVAGLLLAAPGTAPVRAAELFEADMDGERSGTPSGGTGYVSLILNDARTEATYHITYRNLTSPEVAAHFHSGAPGEPGPVLFTLPLGTPKDGVWSIGTRALADLLAGNVYVNIHTDNYPGGEIRGNLSFAAVPAEQQAWGAVRALYR